MKINKKNILTTALAITLAVVTIIGGGSFAYLQGKTNDTVNTFKTNKVLVNLEETTGKEYNIIPGTSQAKDPKVTVDNTVDAYVYVEVTDATDGLVTYEIADGWKKLGGENSNIYFREVGKDDEIKEFSVLKDNTVKYAASLENSNMLNENGQLKQGIHLTFKSYAVQKEPFNDAINAFYQSNTIVNNASELEQAINDSNNNDPIILKDDITIDESIAIPENSNVEIALAGHKLTSENKHAVIISNGANATIKDGVVDATAHTSAAIYNDGGTVTLENVTLTRSQEAGASANNDGGNSYYVILNHGTMTINEGTVVKANGQYSSLIENGWQNGARDNTDGVPAKLIINGGTFSGGLNTVKNDDYGVLEINDGYFKNDAQYCVMNWNEATINGGTFVTTNNYAIWNRSADVTMDKGELTITNGYFQYPSKYRGVYIYNDCPVKIMGGTYATKSVCNKQTTSITSLGYEIKGNSDGTYSVVPKNDNP